MANVDILAIAVGLAVPIWVWAILLVAYWVSKSGASLALQSAAITWLVLAILGMSIALDKIGLLSFAVARPELAIGAGLLISILLGVSIISGCRKPGR